MNKIKKYLTKTNLFLLSIILIGIVLYGVTLRGVSGNPKASDIKNNLDQVTKPLELSPERGRFILTMSLAENKSLSLTKELADAANPDAGFAQGKYYILFAPGVSLLALPFYWIGKLFHLSQVGSFATIPFFAIFSMILLFKISTRILKLPPEAGLLSALIFGFASTSWSYATTLYQHHVTTFFILSALYAVWKYKKNTKYAYLWACYVWFAYAYGILVDYPNAMFMMPVMVYFLLSSVDLKDLENRFVVKFNPLIAISSIIFIIITGLHLYSNYVHYGSWSRLSNTIVSTKTIEEHKVFEKGHKAFKKIEDDKTAASYFREINLPKGLTILLAGPDKGILLFSPIFAVAILGIWQALRKPTLEIGILLSLVVSNILLYASFGDPWGGWAFGPRYLIISMSILALFIPMWLVKHKYVLLKKAVVLCLFIASAAISLVGALTTNAIPPRIEAVALGSKYNFLRNIDFLLDNRSSSFFYNTFLQNNISLPVFYVVCLAALIAVVAGVIYFVPAEKK